MAKITYFRSPIDELQRKDFESDKPIIGIVQDLGIEKLALCITINGVTPDDLDPYLIPSEQDVIEIRRLVHGEGSASQKRDLTTIVQIAALVAVTVLSGGTATPYTGAKIAILVGSAIISGALMKRAAELSSGATGQDISEVEINGNKYSLTNASNEARPLSPMPLVMGSTRMAPDFQADAYKSVYGQVQTTGEIAPIQAFFYPGNEATNGVNSVGSNWASMPADYIATGFPKYAIKIAPYHFLNVGEALTPTNEAAILTRVKNDWLANGSPSYINFERNGYIGLQKPFAPLVVYHSDASDPMFGRYNLFYFLARIFEYWGNNLTEYTNRNTALFNGVTVGDNQENYIFASNGIISGSSSKFNMRITAVLLHWYPSTLVSVESNLSLMLKAQTFLYTLNNAVLNSSNKTSSFQIENFTLVNGITSIVAEGIDYSTQVFNYGIGDLVISERKIGLYDVDQNDYDLASFSPIRKGTSFDQWLIPSVSAPIAFLDYFVSVLLIDRKSISNSSSPTSLTPLTDLNQYNFILMEGKPGQNAFKFELAGQLYGTSGGGITTNNCTVEVHIKKDTDTNWSYPVSFGVSKAVFAVSNNNTKKLNLSIFSQLDVLANERMQVRVRKITADSVNNENGNICNLYVDNIRFYKNANYWLTVGYNERLLNAPQNQEGLALTALVSDAAQTNRYSALVESKCWVYDFDLETWSWTFNRNPAFWFLYFARGGFLNLPSSAQFPYASPYSPTWGWQNYPGHPDNTEIIFGAGLTDDKIDIDKIIEWAQFCEAEELYLDWVLRDDTSCSEVLERIANVGRGSCTYYNGLLSVIYEDINQAPTCMFGMGNILAGSFSVNYQVADPVAKVIGKFVNRDTWESEEVEAVVPYASSENIKTIEVNLEAVTEKQQAQREVNILAARQFFQRRFYSWDVDVEGLMARRGDLVYLSHDSTQYGYSGRINKFIVNAGIVEGVETSSILDSSINYVTIREPNGDMNIYESHVEGNNIIFDEAYPIEKASFWIDNNTDNALTDYPGSDPEDFIFISGAKETPGKLVRISEIKSKDDFNFTISAVDEDPAMWSYEYDGVPLDPESFDNAEVALSVDNVKLIDLGEGFLKILWEPINGDFISIINEDTGLPIQANGSYTFTGGEVTLELIPNTRYTLIIRPFAVGTPYRSEDKRVRIWLK